MIKKVKKLKNVLSGKLNISPDKSISHRAIILSSFVKGKNRIRNISKCEDCLATIKVLESLGVKFEFKDKDLIIDSKEGFKEPKESLYCGNSGTTMRLMAGILAAQKFKSTLTGDESLSKRPMKRIIEPLKQMGADITSDFDKAPLKIQGKNLKGIEYHSPLASAQVKSCVLLAGLFADGQTIFKEPYKSRDHTELMLEYFGAEIQTDSSANTVKLKGSEKSHLCPKEITIPGDISSAAFFITAALIVPGSEITIKDVGLNLTRTGFLDVIKKMNADIEILNTKIISNEKSGDIKIKFSNLKSTTIEGEIIPRLIDELPIIAVLATQAEGETIIKDAQDLRNKESNRIKSIVLGLKKIGANIKETKDGFVIKGKSNLKGNAQVDTKKDHRLAMSFYIAGLICENPIIIKDFEWVKTSFPEFEMLINQLIKDS